MTKTETAMDGRWMHVRAAAAFSLKTRRKLRPTHATATATTVHVTSLNTFVFSRASDRGTVNAGEGDHRAISKN
jgi:hypothetical protein